MPATRIEVMTQKGLEGLCTNPQQPIYSEIIFPLADAGAKAIFSRAIDACAGCPVLELCKPQASNVVRRIREPQYPPTVIGGREVFKKGELKPPTKGEQVVDNLRLVIKPHEDTEGAIDIDSAEHRLLETQVRSIARKNAKFRDLQHRARDTFPIHVASGILAHDSLLGTTVADDPKLVAATTNILISDALIVEQGERKVYNTVPQVIRRSPQTIERIYQFAEQDPDITLQAVRYYMEISDADVVKELVGYANRFRGICERYPGVAINNMTEVKRLCLDRDFEGEKVRAYVAEQKPARLPRDPAQALRHIRAVLSEIPGKRLNGNLSPDAKKLMEKQLDEYGVFNQLKESLGDAMYNSSLEKMMKLLKCYDTVTDKNPYVHMNFVLYMLANFMYQVLHFNHMGISDATDIACRISPGELRNLANRESTPQLPEMINFLNKSSLAYHERVKRLKETANGSTLRL